MKNKNLNPNPSTIPPEDPFVMYLILRESLKMSNGKMCVSVGHAVQLLFEKYLDLRSTQVGNCLEFYNLIKEKTDDFEAWQGSFYRKVILVANDKIFNSIKEDFKSSLVTVVDLGLVEVPPNSETCIGLFPMRKSESPKIIKKLQTLK